MSWWWHRGPNHSLPQLDEDCNTFEHDSGAGSDGEDLGEGSDGPLEDEVIGDESDAIDWDLLDHSVAQPFVMSSERTLRLGMLRLVRDIYPW